MAFCTAFSAISDQYAELLCRKVTVKQGKVDFSDFFYYSFFCIYKYTGNYLIFFMVETGNSRAKDTLFRWEINKHVDEIF